MRAVFVLAAGAIGLVLLGAPGATAGPPPALVPPDAAVVAEAQAIVARMRDSGRGPYRYLRWYCNDGTVHPPMPYPCRERGGGNQHADYSSERARLVELGWSVGTIIHALTWDELWDVERRHQRLRELALERFLVEVDDGWVLHRAQYYRGRIQVEDEEVAGTKLLARLLADPTWIAANFLLARESVRVIPCAVGGGDRTRTVRRISKEIAALDPSFESIRTKLHTAPEARDVDRIRMWVANAPARAVEPALLKQAQILASEVETMFGARGRAERLLAAKRILSRRRLDALAVLLNGITELPGEVRVARLGGLLRALRDRIASSTDGALNLELLALSIDAEDELMTATATLLASTWGTRAELLELARNLTDAGYGSGLLSAREQETLAAPLRRLRSERLCNPRDYLDAARGLQRSGGWALGTVRYTYAEPMVRYAALTRLAEQFPDDLLRGSAMLPLARVVARLTSDAEHLTGMTHEVFGQPVSGLVGLNPGVAVGRLRVVGDDELARGVSLAADEIVVLPQTVSELTPVAGIISLGEGNILSHVQLLARNLGIPNAALSPILRPAVAAFDGQQVLFAIDDEGSVILREVEQVPSETRARLLPSNTAPDGTEPVDAPIPDLTVREPLPLVDLHSGLSGRVVGPKAANLGQLALTFPGRVEGAVALPFGIFAAHANADTDGPKHRLDRAFERFRAGEIDLAERDAEIEAVRLAVAALELHPELRATLEGLLEPMFGPPGSYGVFIRSDTNVEDLPQFTGAGLNETLPNVVGMDAIARGIARVWSSPFTRRAIAWRARILRRPEEVYPSILLMKSVPSDKSGVLVTSDLVTGGDGLTVAVAWGIGGAVDGESAESMVLRRDGGTLLLAEAKAPYSRALAKTGGLLWRPAPAGAVLETGELAQLRAFAAEAIAQLEPVLGEDGKALPWDVEFGFVNGRLTLFQVRPLVERGRALANRIVRDLRPDDARRDTPVDLGGRPGTPAANGGR